MFQNFKCLYNDMHGAEAVCFPTMGMVYCHWRLFCGLLQCRYRLNVLLEICNRLTRFIISAYLSPTTRPQPPLRTKGLRPWFNREPSAGFVQFFSRCFPSPQRSSQITYVISQMDLEKFTGLNRGLNPRSTRMDKYLQPVKIKDYII